MTLKLIEQMSEAALYVQGLENKAAAMEAMCEDQSRIIACFVRIQGGRIHSEVWEDVHEREGFHGYGKRVYVDGVQITVTEPGDA